MKLSAGEGSFLSSRDAWSTACFWTSIEVEAKDGRTLTLLLFSYRIGGVDYECSQDITAMRDVVNAAEVRAGFPCTVRYQPGNPHNSIVVGEGWTGLARTASATAFLRKSRPCRHEPPAAREGVKAACWRMIPAPVKLTICMFTRRRPGKGATRTTLVLRISMAATLAYVVVTFVAGLRAHSLALLSESGHNVSDFWRSCSAL